MIKFVLVLHLCSFLPGATSCLSNQYVGQFTDYYSCVKVGYAKAYESLESLDKDNINKNRLAVKIECKELEVS